MRLCYQMATPDVTIAPSVTAFQGDMEHCIRSLSGYGYDAVELMVRNPRQVNVTWLKDLLAHYHMEAALVCTGEIYGQGGLNVTDPDPAVRQMAMERVHEIIDFAALLHANINIGRVRGSYRDDEDQTEQLAVEAFQALAAHAQDKGVRIALEPVTYLQTNFINTVAQAYDMARRVGSPAFGLMMDLFHMHIEEKDIFQTIARYGGSCFHVHLADNDRRYPGHGGLDFHKILQTFRDSGYDGDFCTEIYQLPDQDTAARESIACLAPALQASYGRGGKV